ncbi:HNH endonuclease [Paraburkholderia sediminicola]|uniref:HNH endonuclease n=1 Tax=Paraburkholderia sediminicola TaxID=458836 RepID=UPI0038B6C7F2
MKHTKLTQEITQALGARYTYDAATGEFRDTTRNNSIVKSAHISLADGRKVRTGRAIYALVTGADIGDGEIIRHVDGDNRNRVWANLQLSRYSDIEREPATKKSLIPHLEFLRECFEYDATTGHLIWKVRPVKHFKREASQKMFNTRLAGKRAGTLQGRDSRLQVHITSGAVKLNAYTSNIVWALAYGKDVPEGLVLDHKNGNRDDETLGNLRIATVAGNARNSNSSRTQLGLRGIWERSGKFNVKFSVNTSQMKYKFLRSFDTLHDAKMCRKALEFKYHGEFAWTPVDWTPELQTWLDNLEFLNRAGTKSKRK